LTSAGPAGKVDRIVNVRGPVERDDAIGAAGDAELGRGPGRLDGGADQLETVDHDIADRRDAVRIDALRR
jgi:hypothetical protein